MRGHRVQARPRRASLLTSARPLFWSLVLPALAAFLPLPAVLASSATDNSIVGEPAVQCASDSLSLNFHTTNNFSGRIFVRGYSAESQCQQSGTGVQQRSHAFSVAYDRCGLRRTREAGGVSFTTTVVVSFHPIFVTKIDRAFRVNCFYTETVQRTVFQRLDVGPLSTESITRHNDLAALPTCRYDILAGGPDGAPIKFARIGDVIYHRWSCDSTNAPTSTDKYCMRVHSCSVNDGQGGGAYTVLDREGCEVDAMVLPTLRYTGDLTAGQATSVFMFADRSTLNFNCQVELTIRESAYGGCDGAQPQCKSTSREPVNKSLNASPSSPSPPGIAPPDDYPNTYSTQSSLPTTLAALVDVDDITDLSDVYRVHELPGVRYELRENSAISTMLTPVEPIASRDPAVGDHTRAAGRGVAPAVRFGASSPSRTQVSPSSWTAEPSLLSGIFDDESSAAVAAANISPPRSYAGRAEPGGGGARQHFDEAAIEGGASARAGGIRIRKSQHPSRNGPVSATTTATSRRRRKVVDFDLPERQLIVLDLDERVSSPQPSPGISGGGAAQRGKVVSQQARNECVSYALFLATLSIAALLLALFLTVVGVKLVQRAVRTRRGEKDQASPFQHLRRSAVGKAVGGSTRAEHRPNYATGTPF